MTLEMRRSMAKTILRYMQSMPVDEPAPGWQDHILISALNKLLFEEDVKVREAELGESRTQAAFYAYFAQLSDKLDATTEEIKEVREQLKRGKPIYDQVTITEVAEEIAKLREVTLSADDLKQRRTLADVAGMVETAIKKHERNKWLIFIEGILVGLVTNGLYDLLKESVLSLVTRAPYAEAQIYEIESDVWQSRERWQSSIPTEDQFNEFGELEREIAFTFIIHALCVTRIVGALNMSGNETYTDWS